MTEFPAAVIAPSVPKSSFLALRDRSDSIRRVRTFVGAAVFGLPYAVDEIELVAVELVTNAIRAVRTLGPLPYDVWPIGLEITATARFAHLIVTDIDHRPIGGVNEGGRLSESGRGLGIVDWYATARWVVYEERRKAVHVVIAAPGVTPTPVELDALRATAATGPASSLTGYGDGVTARR